jgi:hypothetical protein
LLRSCLGKMEIRMATARTSFVIWSWQLTNRYIVIIKHVTTVIQHYLKTNFVYSFLVAIISAEILHKYFWIMGILISHIDRLCGLVVRVPSYRSRCPGFDSRRYQIFWKVVGLERGPLSLVRITEELLEWKSSGSGQENRINGRGDPLRWPPNTLYSQELALTSPTSGGRSVGIV